MFVGLRQSSDNDRFSLYMHPIEAFISAKSTALNKEGFIAIALEKLTPVIHGHRFDVFWPPPTLVTPHYYTLNADTHITSPVTSET